MRYSRPGESIFAKAKIDHVLGIQVWV